MQAERTRLSWARTALALAVLGGLELRIGQAHLPVLSRLPAAITLLVALITWWYGGHRYRAINAALAAGRPLLVGRQLIAITVLVGLLPVLMALAVLVD